MTTLWHQRTSEVSNYELACMTDAKLLRLHVNTLAIPAYARTREDAQLLDRIGQHWRARKSPALRAA